MTHRTATAVLSLALGLALLPPVAQAQTAPAARQNPPRNRPAATPAAPAAPAAAAAATSPDSLAAPAAQRSAAGGDFTEVQAQKLATLDADVLCHRLYDSASPVSMLIELATILGPSVLLSQAPDLTGYSVEQRKKVFVELRNLAKRKVWLPVSLEAKVGDWMNEKYLRDGEVLPADRLVRRDRERFERIKGLLESVAAKLPADNPFPLRLGVMRGDQPNANITLGGYIYVTQGLLRDSSRSEPELALMLAHEVGHLTRRHALKDFQIKLIDAMELANNVKGMVGFATDPVATVNGVLGGVKAAQLLFQHFDHVQEMEGDACGMQLVRQAQPAFAVPAFNAYSRRTADNAPEQSWGRSHPPYEQRSQVLRMQIDDDARRRYEQQNKLASGGPRPGAAGAGGGGISGGGAAALSPGSGPGTGVSAVKSDDASAAGSTGPSFFERLRNALPSGDASGQAPAGPKEP